MAEVVGFVSSLAGLAAFGVQIVTTLNTFATSYSRAEVRVQVLSANISLTSSLLKSICGMIEEYEGQFLLTVDNFVANKRCMRTRLLGLIGSTEDSKEGQGETKEAGREYQEP